MIVRAKTKRRLVFLVVGVVLAAAVLATAVLLLKQRRTRYFMGQRETGMEAFQKKDYETAINSLAIYIGRYPDDAEAVYTLAQAQSSSDSPDGRHLAISAQLLKRFLDLQPARDDVRRELVLLYSRIGFSTEVIDFSKPLLEKKPDDVPVLVANAKALIALRDFKRAITLSQQAIKLSPMEVEAQAATLELYGYLDRKAEILPHAIAILEGHPRDARAELLMMVACVSLGELSADDKARISQLVARQYPPDAQEKVKFPDGTNEQPVNARSVAAFFIRQAALHPVPDRFFAQYMVWQLDRLRLPSEAADALDHFLKSEVDAPMRRQLVRRFFELGRFADVEKRLADVKLRNAGVDLEMHAIKAISVAAMDRKADATQIAEQLAVIPNDRIAHAWSTILKQAVLAKGEPLEVVKATRDALDIQKTNPYLRYYLAEAYASLGERDLAIDSYRQVLAHAPLWPLPLVHLSRLCIEDGQTQLALDAARAAAELTFNPVTASNLASIWAAALGKDEALANSDLQRLLAVVQQAVPGEERTLPVHIVALAKSGKRIEAEKALRDALASKPPPSESLLLKLASASAEAGLGLEDECYAQVEKQFGVTPDLAFIRAMKLAAAGRLAEGATLLETAAKNASLSQKAPWRLALAHYYERNNDPRSAATWVALADDPEMKANLNVQRTAIAASSVQSDRAFLLRTIDRIRTITGEQAAGWRVARAKVFLAAESPSKADLDEAAKLLGEVVSAVPSHLESRQLLAAVHSRLGNSDAAIDQLLAAQKLKPQNITLMLELARLYQVKSDVVHAREQIDRILNQIKGPDGQPEPSRLQIDPVRRRQLAAMLMAQGDSLLAAKVIENQAAPSTNPTDILMLAELHRRRNDTAKAEQLYRQALKSPNSAIIVSAANFFAATGRKPEAERTLAGLSGLSIAPGEKELAYAEYYALHGTKEQATEQYRAAVKAGPGNSAAWRALVANHLINGRVDEAFAAASQAAAAIPSDKVFQAFQVNTKELKTVAADRPFVPLILWILQERGDTNAALEAIRIGANATLTNQPPDAIIAKLRPIADRFPGLAPLQTLLIMRCLAADRIPDAVTLAQRSAKAVPASPEIAQLAAEVMATSGDYTQAIAFGKQWRELSLSNPLPADLFIAQMQIRLGNTNAAAESIAPYLQAAIANPDGFRDVVIMQARILLARGQHNEVADLLWPSVSRSADWRKVWFELIVSMGGNAAVATAWLDRVSQIIPQTAIDERIVVAQLWQTFAQRTNDPKFADRARSILNELNARPAKSPELLFSLAIVEQAGGNLDQADKLYRQAIEKRPDFAAAQNNLAMLIATRNGNLAEAVSLASNAVRAMPGAPAFYDTLGHVQAKAKDYKGAIASLTKAVQLEPRNPAWLINLALVYDQAGQRADMERLVRQAELAVQGRQISPEYQRKLAELRDKVSNTSRSATLPN